MENKFKTVQKLVPLVSISPNNYNPNIQSELIKNKLKKSIKEHGFTCPILVRSITDSEYEIIDGQHRWQACIDLGYDVIKVEDMGKVEDSIAKVLTIALNNIRGQDDILKRAEILKQLNEGQLSLLPWNEEEIKNELALVDFDWEQYNKEEKVEEKRSQTFIFNLTEAEYKIVQYAITLTSKKGNEALLAIVKEYLELRVDITKYEGVFNKRSEISSNKDEKNMSEEIKEENKDEEIAKEETEENKEEEKETTEESDGGKGEGIEKEEENKEGEETEKETEESEEEKTTEGEEETEEKEKEEEPV